MQLLSSGEDEWEGAAGDSAACQQNALQHLPGDLEVEYLAETPAPGPYVGTDQVTA